MDPVIPNVDRDAEGHKTALELAAELAHAEELARGERQGDLFGAAPEQSEIVASERGRGRPPGKALTTLTAARWHMARHGDPLERGIEIAGLPVLAKGVLEGLAERLGCTRHEAAKFWAGVLATQLCRSCIRGQSIGG